MVDDELYVIVGSERLTEKSSHSGSTRTRLMLACHAVIETAIQMKSPTPRLLVLDAPRLQELSAEDLREYLDAFQAMSAAADEPIQVVISATDREVLPAKVEALWQPPYTFEDGPRFFGPRSGSAAQGTTG